MFIGFSVKRNLKLYLYGGVFGSIIILMIDHNLSIFIVNIEYNFSKVNRYDSNDTFFQLN